MLEYIQGKLISIHPKYLVIDNQGIGYHIRVANPYGWNEYLSQDVSIFIELVVREDSMTLYGFKDNQEKELFQLLNRVSNIGPKSALAILALEDHQGLTQAIDGGDVTYLTKFPGVGKKTAQQMILDLKGKLDLVQVTQADQKRQSISETGQDQLLDEVYQALEGLGYSKREIKGIDQAMRAQGFESSQEALSFAFKLLIH